MLLFVVHPVSTGTAVDSTPPLDIVAVIPARFGSTRFPGKPLAEIDGRSMIEHVYRRATASTIVSRVIVATDDLRVATTVTGFGGQVRLTRPDHQSGTDRLAEVVSTLACDIVVNVQGDEPLLDARSIAEVVAPFSDPAISMTTLYRRIQDPAELSNPHVVKVVLDRGGFAMYFSGRRFLIPAIRARDGLPCIGISVSMRIAEARCWYWQPWNPRRSNEPRHLSSCVRSSTASASKRWKPPTIRSVSTRPRISSRCAAFSPRRHRGSNGYDGRGREDNRWTYR